jgi:hypothetical protein
VLRLILGQSAQVDPRSVFSGSSKVSVLRLILGQCAQVGSKPM